MWLLYLLQTWCCLDPFWVGVEQSKLCCHFRSNVQCGLGQASSPLQTSSFSAGIQSINSHQGDTVCEVPC